jgi:hypothetical protein
MAPPKQQQGRGCAGHQFEPAHRIMVDCLRDLSSHASHFELIVPVKQRLIQQITYDLRAGGMG